MRRLLATSMTGCPMTHLVGLCSPMCQTTPCSGLHALWLHLSALRSFGLTSMVSLIICEPACRAAVQGCLACIAVQAPQWGLWGAGFRHEAAILPFELHVLEVAIGDVCQLCSGLVKELESSGHPILDTLVKHVRPCPSPYPSLLPCVPADCGTHRMHQTMVEF